MTWKLRVRESALRSSSQAIDVDSQIATRIGGWAPFPFSEVITLKSFAEPIPV